MILLLAIAAYLFHQQAEKFRLKPWYWVIFASVLYIVIFSLSETLFSSTTSVQFMGLPPVNLHRALATVAGFVVLYLVMLVVARIKKDNKSNDNILDDEIDEH